MRPAPEPPIDAEEPAGPALPPAGLGARALAYLLDLLVLFLAWVTGLLLYSISGDLLRQVQALSLAGQLLALAAALGAGWGWDVAWEVAWRGQTPGKRALGLRVVRADGAPVGPVESIVRNALRAVELPLGYAPGVLMVALSARRQRLGDLVAGTLVVQERRYDLSRYGPPAAAAARWAGLRGRAAGLLDA
ncbi:MAG TPA: RDD family protein, partial [Anaeromyxobacteraceae bacterium]|nr:RDD family protein [Anaeromyxobacteraceae bacterium]